MHFALRRRNGFSRRLLSCKSVAQILSGRQIFIRGPKSNGGVVGRPTESSFQFCRTRPVTTCFCVKVSLYFRIRVTRNVPAFVTHLKNSWDTCRLAFTLFRRPFNMLTRALWGYEKIRNSWMWIVVSRQFVANFRALCCKDRCGNVSSTVTTYRVSFDFYSWSFERF